MDEGRGFGCSNQLTRNWIMLGNQVHCYKRNAMWEEYTSVLLVALVQLTAQQMSTLASCPLITGKCPLWLCKWTCPQATCLFQPNICRSKLSLTVVWEKVPISVLHWIPSPHSLWSTQVWLLCQCSTCTGPKPPEQFQPLHPPPDDGSLSCLNTIWSVVGEGQMNNGRTTWHCLANQPSLQKYTWYRRIGKGGFIRRVFPSALALCRSR